MATTKEKNVRVKYFDNMLSKLLKWENDYPNQHLRSIFEYEGLDIGTWFTNQQTKHKKSLLSQEKQDKLASSSNWQHFILNMNDPNYDWLIMLEHVIQYETETNNFVHKSLTHNGIGPWMSDNKKKYNKGLLSTDRQQLLQKSTTWLKFLNKNVTKEVEWFQHFDTAINYENTSGKALTERQAQDLKIRYWFVNNKKQFLAKTLSENKIQKLNQLQGWEQWLNNDPMIQWYNMLETALTLQRNGVTINTKTKFENYNVGSWLNSQKRAFKNNTLDENKLTLLNQLVCWQNFLATV